MRPALALLLLLLLLLTGCAAPAAHVPPFARLPYEPFSRSAAIAIALGEWRAFGMVIDDDAPGTRPAAADKPERQQGLWQRVGEYWWLGLDAGAPQARWTGKHDAAGQRFAPQDDERYAWSAAFISYVMRMAGAGAGFPYAAAHHVYINAARRGDRALVLSAQPPDAYAPVPGDVICMSRTATPLRFDDLPAGRFPAHCDIVVARAVGMLSVIGGNVDDAVTLKHVPITAAGMLNDARYAWFVVLRIAYAAD